MAGAPSSPGGPLPWSVLRQRAVKGSFWWAGLYPLSKGVQIGANVVLAALLTPAAFGIVAIATVAVRAVSMFTEIGIASALVQSHREDDRFVNTAWTMQFGRGVLVCLVSLLLASPIARTYDEPQLLPIVCVIGLGSIIGGLRSTNYVTLHRSLIERPRALLDIGNSVVTRVGMIVVALLWPSAWCLVIGTLCGNIFVTIGTHVFFPGRRNRFAWDSECARILVRFGSWVFVGTVIAYLGGQLDTLVLGKLVSARLGALGLVGVYEIAQRIARLPIEATHLLGGQLAFPVLSEVSRREPARFRDRLLQIRGVMLPAAAAFCLGVIVLSPWFFRALYDERYAAAGWMAPLITASAWVALLNGFANDALMALGRTRALAITGAIGVVTSIGGSLVGYLVADVPGFIIGLACGDFLRHLADLAFLARAGAPMYGPDLRWTVAFLGLAGICAAGRMLGGGASGAVVRWGVGVALPALVFLAASIWAATKAWKVARKR